MYSIRQGFRKLSSDRHTDRLDATEIIYTTPPCEWSNIGYNRSNS